MRKKKKVNINKIRPNYFLLPFMVLLFVGFGVRIFYLCTSEYQVGDVTISEFIKNRNTKEDTILPKRGSILDKNGNVLAEDVASYTVIAYLNKDRSKNSKKPLHVVDIDATAKALAPLINTDEMIVKTILSKKDVYQVEFGVGGKNLSQIEMEKIRDLKLPGIDFVASTKRYYPNSDFASYIVGYTVNEEDKSKNIWKVGQLGIEEYFNDELTGKKGYITYERDRNGYKIANGREYKEDATNGNNIYLTIDSSIELFTENAVKKMVSESEAEWGLMVLADAKTGAILSYSTAPSFDPNKRNIKNYVDLLTGNTYEPGSTMKIFSYLCAIDNETYDDKATYKSGSITYSGGGSSITIHDWNKIGWGNITYDYGFAMSSNVGAAGLLESGMIDKKKLKTCYTKYGFGKTTGFTLKREVNGSIKFNYDVDAASASFGQAVTITPIQMIQALTMISNNGVMLEPYVIDKIVDSDTDKVTYEATTEVIDEVVKSTSVTKIKELMKNVVCNDSKKCTGSAYYMEDYPIMGKTGTAQIYDEKTGTYMKGESDYVYSFAGMYPTDDPKLIIYTILKKPKDTKNYVADAVKNVVIDTSKYLNIVEDSNKFETYTLKNYSNKKTNNIKEELETKKIKTIILGSGDKIINQYPSKGMAMYKDSIVCLLTDKYEKTMPNLIGLSKKDAINILKLMNVEYETEGSGYVTEQNIKENEKIENNKVVLKLG